MDRGLSTDVWDGQGVCPAWMAGVSEMTRTYGDRIVVGGVCPRGERGGAPGTPPAWWLWRGRRYVVCEVLDHWHDRRAWWNTALPTHRIGTDAEVWRVEALGPCWRGVYDLHHDPLDACSPGVGWRLARVWD